MDRELRVEYSIKRLQRLMYSLHAVVRGGKDINMASQVQTVYTCVSLHVVGSLP